MILYDTLRGLFFIWELESCDSFWLIKFLIKES